MGGNALKQTVTRRYGADEYHDLAERFNGDVVKTITGLQGKELGLFISFCKSRHEHAEGGFRKFILKLNSELVGRYINYLYLVYAGDLPRLEDEVFKEATKHLNYNKE